MLLDRVIITCLFSELLLNPEGLFVRNVGLFNRVRTCLNVDAKKNYAMNHCNESLIRIRCEMKKTLISDDGDVAALERPGNIARNNYTEKYTAIIFEMLKIIDSI